jgi:alpha-N-acetylglucosamine transferase
MQALIISTIANVILIILVLSLFRNRMIEVYKKYKIKRERQRVTRSKEEIRKIVIEYLEEIKNG